MKEKIVQNEEGKANPKLEKIKDELKGQVEVIKQELNVELTLAKEVEINNLDNIKVEIKKSWVKVDKEKVKFENRSKRVKMGGDRTYITTKSWIVLGTIE